MDALILLAVAGGFAAILLLGQLLAGIYFAACRYVRRRQVEAALSRLPLAAGRSPSSTTCATSVMRGSSTPTPPTAGSKEQMR